MRSAIPNFSELMANKRYKRTRAEHLLEEVLALVQTKTATERHVRDVILHLQATLGMVALGDTWALWSPIEVATWQADMLGLLRNLAPESSTIGHELPIVALGPLVITTVCGANGDVQLCIEGANCDVATYFVVQLLREAGAARIRRCDCDAVFVKVGRREFCSKRCQKRVYMRVYYRDLRNQQEMRRHGKTTRTR